MKLELHMIHSLPPHSINRDDTGSPKDAFFGGVRRGRISSQSLKYAMRQYFRQKVAIATRTRYVKNLLVEKLAANHPLEAAQSAAENALKGLMLGVEDNKTQYLLLLSPAEIEALVAVIEKHFGDLQSKSGTKDKKAASKELAASTVEELNAALQQQKTIDQALFGRLMSDLPQHNIDGALQVAHSISVHALEPEFDFYTAQDDLQQQAAMLSHTDFNSATHYRYLNLDLPLLAKHLPNPKEAVALLIEAAVQSLPSGKQNAFAALTLPSFVMACLTPLPHNLANAFESPIVSKSGYVAPAISALLQEHLSVEAVFGPRQSFILNRSTLDLQQTYPDFNSLQQPYPDLNSLIAAVVSHLEG